MSVPRGHIGHGTTVEYSEDGGVTYTTITRMAQIERIGFGEAEEIDITGFDSPNKVMEKIQGLKDPGSIDMTGIWTGDAVQVAVQQLHKAGTTVLWRVTISSDGVSNVGVAEFSGYVGNYGITPPVDDRVEFDLSVVISGTVSLTVT